MTPVESCGARAEVDRRRGSGVSRSPDTEAVAGGGSLPGLTIPSVGVALTNTAEPEAARAALRDHDVIARVDDGVLVCDLRTVDPDDDALLPWRACGACHAPGNARLPPRVTSTTGSRRSCSRSPAPIPTASRGEGAGAHHRPRLRVHHARRPAPRSGSSTCPGTSASSRTCSRAWAPSTWCCSSSRHRRMDGAERRAPRGPRPARCAPRPGRAATNGRHGRDPKLDSARIAVSDRLARSSLARRSDRGVRLESQEAGSTTCAPRSTRCCSRRRPQPIKAGRGCGSTACSRLVARARSSPARWSAER